MRRYLIAGSVLLLPVLAGCATTGGDDMMNTVYNTNRIVRNLEQNLTPTVNKLNQTTADLGARVDASEQQTGRMAQQLEASTASLQQIQQQLEDLQKVIYRQNGMSAPQAGAPIAPPAGVQVGPIVKENPSETPDEMDKPDAGMSSVPPAGGGAAPIAPTTVAQAPPTPVTPPPPPPAAEKQPEPQPAPPVAGDAGGQELYKKASSEFLASNYEQAKTLYDQYIQQNPNGSEIPSAQFWRARSQMELSRYKDAIQDFEKLRKSYPTNQKVVPSSLYYQAEAHLQLGQTNEAVALLKQLVAEWPMTRPAAKAKAELEKRGIQ
jgi:TolA-binding protein